jgi:hypothetical protein
VPASSTNAHPLNEEASSLGTLMRFAMDVLRDGCGHPP